MLNPDFKEFAELLASNQVEYLIVGGYALAAHGQPALMVSSLRLVLRGGWL